MRPWPSKVPWAHLSKWARAEVRATVAKLPRTLGKAARRLPVTYEPVPGSDLVGDGIEPDTLGLFVGPCFHEEEAVYPTVPAQIILFLGNLWELAEGEQALFQAEVRKTYLHELGHYLGLDEDALFDRGLD